LTDASPRFALPFLVPGQAQKEHCHNEALVLADLLIHACVEAGPIASPPPDPEPGQAWIVASPGQGAWSGKNHCIAGWTESGWRFAAPVPGMAVWKKDAGFRVYWTGSAWSSGELPATALFVGGQQVVGERQPAVPSPSGGTIIDQQARATLGALIVALRSHGLID
jgi:hypothetical protein